jgi:FKBP-type peptidyl-prolyl cis-trans isomerase
MSNRFAFASLGLALLLSFSCGDDPLEPATDPRDVTFAAELNVDLDRMTRTSSGLYYEDVSVGAGTQATVGAEVDVLYSGWLPNGSLFDSRTASSNPFSFILGIGQVIAGWDEGVSGMRVGGIRLLVVPPQLGYGPSANGPIPGNSVLVFRVQLLAVD